MPKLDGVGMEMQWLGRGDHASIHVLMAAVGIVPNDGEALVLEVESYLIGAATDGVGKEQAGAVVEACSHFEVGMSRYAIV